MCVLAFFVASLIRIYDMSHLTVSVVKDAEIAAVIKGTLICHQM